MTLEERFCKLDYARLFLIEVEPEIRIRQEDAYDCKVCGQKYIESDTLTHQQKMAIMQDTSKQQLLGFGDPIQNVRR